MGDILKPCSRFKEKPFLEVDRSDWCMFQITVMSSVPDFISSMIMVMIRVAIWF